MTQQQIDETFMRRCLQIARGGQLTAKPNPSVGAVIVAGDGRIIGEGFTSAYGGPHAEVNAFASVRPEDEPLLGGATVYVSLEPCSHWGHTPPCCDLIIRKGSDGVSAAAPTPMPRYRDAASSACVRPASRSRWACCTMTAWPPTVPS